jgi:ABC-type uncharacterized transport system ATPase subunit
MQLKTTSAMLYLDGIPCPSTVKVLNSSFRACEMRAIIGPNGAGNHDDGRRHRQDPPR